MRTVTMQCARDWHAAFARRGWRKYSTTELVPRHPTLEPPRPCCAGDGSASSARPTPLHGVARRRVAASSRRRPSRAAAQRARRAAASTPRQSQAERGHCATASTRRPDRQRRLTLAQPLQRRHGRASQCKMDRKACSSCGGAPGTWQDAPSSSAGLSSLAVDEAPPRLVAHHPAADL